MTSPASFFKKSTPTNVIIILGFAVVYYILVNFFFIEHPPTLGYGLEKTGLLLVYLLTAGLLNFIAKRNKIVQNNSYVILLFVLFAVAFPRITFSSDTLLSGFFLMLALRRIISLRTGKSIKQKILDSSIWLMVATLFVPTAFLFFIVLYLAVFFYASTDYRHWIIPILGILTVSVLTLVYYLFVFESFALWSAFYTPPNFDFSLYGNLRLLLPLSLLLAVSIWVVVYYFKQSTKVSGTLKFTYSIILSIWVVGILASLFSPTKNGSETLYFLIPTSIIGAKYFQSEGERIFKELLLGVLILMALILPFF